MAPTIYPIQHHDQIPVIHQAFLSMNRFGADSVLKMIVGNYLVDNFAEARLDAISRDDLQSYKYLCQKKISSEKSNVEVDDILFKPDFLKVLFFSDLSALINNVEKIKCEDLHDFFEEMSIDQIIYLIEFGSQYMIMILSVMLSKMTDVFGKSRLRRLLLVLYEHHPRLLTLSGKCIFTIRLWMKEMMEITVARNSAVIMFPQSVEFSSIGLELVELKRLLGWSDESLQSLNITMYDLLRMLNIRV